MATFQSVIEGLKILQGYDGVNSTRLWADHDVIYAGPPLDALEGRLKDEDKKRLIELGWHEDSEGDCWARFV